jgi:acetyltransferase-like isoleucine patch superfamily enzyme
VSRWRVWARVAWTVSSYAVVQSLILGVAAVPVAALAAWVAPQVPPWPSAVVLVLAVAWLPSYLLFACTLVGATALVLRVLGWRTAAGAEMRIRDFDWPLMDWARSAMASSVVRVLVGIPLRGTPIWGYFLRLNGAKVGRRVYINSTEVMDASLLEFGDDVVVGAGVHLSGHTVEGGVLKTGRVRVGRGATIGVQTVVGIGVEIGDGCKVGALSLVPKGSRLAAGGVYVGIPVRQLQLPYGERGVAARE